MARSVRPLIAKTLEEALVEIQKRVETKEITEAQAKDLIKFAEMVFKNKEAK